MQNDTIIRSPCGSKSMENWFSLRLRAEFNNSSNLKNKAHVAVSLLDILAEFTLNVD